MFYFNYLWLDKLSKLVGNVLADFNLIKSKSSKKYSRISSYNSEISIRTDAETDDDNIIYVTDETESSSIGIDVSPEEINNINKLAKWLPTNEELKTTPISQRYEYSWATLEKSYVFLFALFVYAIMLPQIQNTDSALH